MPKLSYNVASEFHGKRLDIFLAQSIPDVPSRNFVQDLIKEGKVLVNGQIKKPNQKVYGQDRIDVDFPDEIEQPWDDLAAENIPLDIFFEDDDLLVINKPVGMIVHPASGTYSGTLVNALLYHCRDQLSQVNSAIRPGIVHRLDRETSGLMVVAKNDKTHVNLSRQFEKRIVRKKYIALVEGHVQFDEGVIDASLGKHPRYHDKVAIAAEGEARKAKTFYAVDKRYKHCTLVSLFPKTGRTHQLRVHMAYLGHPILGDDKYGRKETFPRLALHAQGLGFFHPGTTRYLEFSCRPPSEFFLPE